MVQSTIDAFARENVRIAVAVRDLDAGERLAESLRAAGAPAAPVLPFEAADPARCASIVGEARDALGGLDSVLVAHGELTDQHAFEHDADVRARSLRVNGLSAVEILMRAADHLERRAHGSIAAITSGAGERGRRATYGYGLGKGLVTGCLQGLRARLQRACVSVTTIYPCFVDTPMTARLPRAMRRIDPAHAGLRIHAGMRRGQDFVHVPRAWRLALIAARNAPEWLVKRSRAEERFAERLPGGRE